MQKSNNLICIFFLTLLYSPLFSAELIPASRHGLWGFLDEFGNIVYPAKFISVSRFSSGVAKIEIQKGKFSFLYKNGVIKSFIFIHYNTRLFSESMLAIQDKKTLKWGFADINFKIIIPCIYDNVSDFYSGVARVEKNKKSGYIDKKGEILIPLIYSSGKPAGSNGLIAVKKGNLWGYVDKENNIVIDFQFLYAESFSERIAVVSYDKKKYFFIDEKGRWLFNQKFDFCASFSEGVATVGRRCSPISFRYGVIDNFGKIIIPIENDFIYPFSEGKAVYGINGKYGYIDKKFHLVIPLEYEFAESFQNGFACVWTSSEKKILRPGITRNELKNPIYINHKNYKFIYRP